MIEQVRRPRPCSVCGKATRHRTCLGFVGEILRIYLCPAHQLGALDTVNPYTPMSKG